MKDTSGSGEFDGRDRFWRRPWLMLAGVLLAATAVRALAIHRTVAPARDALRYLPAARVFEELPFADALGSIDAHPLYPMTLAGIHRLLAAIGYDGPHSWVLACQWWSAVSYLTFIAISFVVGRSIWNDSIAALGCLALAFVPRQVFYSVDILSDSLHAALWMASFGSLLLAWQAKSARWFAISGLLAGLAYWTRMEAILLPLTFGAAWLLSQMSRSMRWPWRTTMVAGAAFSIGLVAVAGPYIAITGKLSPRNSSRSILGESTVGEPVVRAEESLVESIAGQPLAKPYDPRRSVDENEARGMSPPETLGLPKPNLTPKPFDTVEGYSDRTLTAALLRFGYELSQETRGWILFLAIFAVIDRRRVLASLPGGLLAAVAFLGCSAMLVVLQMKAGYMAGRYMTPVLPFVCMYAMAGAESLATRMAGVAAFRWEANWSISQLRSRRILATYATLTVIALSLCVPDCMRPLHPYRQGHMLAASWLRARTAPDELVFDPSAFSSFFAERPVWRPSEKNADRPPVRYAVIDPSIVYRTEYNVHRTIAKINEIGKPVAQFARTSDGKDVGVYVFELPNPPKMAIRHSAARTAVR